MADMVKGKNDGAKPEVEAVDLMQAALPWKGEARALDPSEDAWSFGAPPPAGPTKMVLSLYKSELNKYNPADESTWSYVLNIEGRVAEGEFAGVPVYLRTSTYRGRGKNISTVEGALIKLGYEGALAGKEVSPGAAASALAKALAKGPEVIWVLDWRAAYKDGDTWTEVLKGMENFPKNADGTYKHDVTITTSNGSPRTVTAQAECAEWVKKGEKPKTRNVAAKAGGKAQVAAGDLDLGDAPMKAGQLVNAKPAVSDELDLG